MQTIHTNNESFELMQNYIYINIVYINIYVNYINIIYINLLMNYLNYFIKLRKESIIALLTFKLTNF